HGQDAGAGIPAADRHGVDRRWRRLPHPQGLHLCRDGFLDRGGDAESDGATPAQPGQAAEKNVAQPIFRNTSSPVRVNTDITVVARMMPEARAMNRSYCRASTNALAAVGSAARITAALNHTLSWGSTNQP